MRDGHIVQCEPCIQINKKKMKEKDKKKKSKKKKRIRKGANRQCAGEEKGEK